MTNSIYTAHVSDALERLGYGGASRDETAIFAADLLRTTAMLSGHARLVGLGVISEAEFDKRVRIALDTSQLAEAVRQRDKLEYPHDQDCPRCGRRQWGGTDSLQCGACAYIMGAEDTWEIYASSGEYRVEAETAGHAYLRFTARHHDDFVLAIVCAGMEPPVAVIEETRESLLTSLRTLVSAIPKEACSESTTRAQEHLHKFITTV
jgi:hypothetical protein